MKLSVRVHGELVRQGLEDLSKEIPDIGRRNMRTVLNRVLRIMQEYPAERPNQTYKRSGNLFSHWKIEPLPQNKGYSIGNTATRKGKEYPQFVVGDAYGTSQAWMHKGRWPNFREVTEKELEVLPKAIENEIVMVSKRIGFDVK